MTQNETGDLHWILSAELGASVGLAKGPVGRGNIVRHNGTAITGGDLEGESLTVEIIVALPILPPVP